MRDLKREIEEHKTCKSYIKNKYDRDVDFKIIIDYQVHTDYIICTKNIEDKKLVEDYFDNKIDRGDIGPAKYIINKDLSTKFVEGVRKL